MPKKGYQQCSGKEGGKKQSKHGSGRKSTFGFQTAKFHVSSGPKSLFDRVAWVLASKPVQRGFAAKSGDILFEIFEREKSSGGSMPCYGEFLNFSTATWQTCTADVRSDTGKWVGASFNVSMSTGQTWHIVMGLHGVIVAAFPVSEAEAHNKVTRAESFAGGVVTRSAQLWQKVATVNADLLKDDWGWYDESENVDQSTSLPFQPCSQCAACTVFGHGAAPSKPPRRRQRSGSGNERGRGTSAAPSLGQSCDWKFRVGSLKAVVDTIKAFEADLMGFVPGSSLELEVLFGDFKGIHQVELLHAEAHRLHVRHISDGFEHAVKMREIPKQFRIRHFGQGAAARNQSPIQPQLYDKLMDLRNDLPQCPDCREDILPLINLMDEIAAGTAVEAVNLRLSISLWDRLQADVRDLPIKEVHFTHDGISSYFRHTEQVMAPLESLVRDLVSQRVSPKDPRLHLDVVYYHGKYRSINNRRLWALKDYQRLVPETIVKARVKILPLLPGLQISTGQDVVQKFFEANDSRDDGSTVVVRGARSRSASQESAAQSRSGSSRSSSRGRSGPSWVAQWRGHLATEGPTECERRLEESTQERESQLDRRARARQQRLERERLLALGATVQSVERRIDPDDGEVLTLDEFTRKYQETYTLAQMHDWWTNVCEPVII